MDYIKVKISNNFPKEPLLRQTPGSKGIWKNCQFFLNENIEECDYWIVYQGLTKEEVTMCPPENTIFITGEPPSLQRYKTDFLKQFYTIISCHRNLQHPNVLHMEQGLPWHIGLAKYRPRMFKVNKDYDQLAAQKHDNKSKLISVITSNKTLSEGHRKRLAFVKALTDHFGERIDVFGRGIRDIRDKWDAIADYKYHIAIENSVYKDYWTEKISDTYLGGAYPIYHGCPNLNDYFDPNAFTAIDIHDVQNSIKTIEDCIHNHLYEKSTEKLAEAKTMVLNKYNLFAIIADFIHSNRNTKTSEKVQMKLQPY